MKQKLLIITFAWWALALIEACCGGSEAFFDFNKLFLENEITSDGNGVTQEVNMYVTPDSIHFLAARSFICTDQLYGTSCPQEGRNGLKEPIVDLEITADQTFQANFPKGTSLKSFFKWGYGDTTLRAFPLDTLSMEGFGLTRIKLHAIARPSQTGVPFRYNIIVRKKNGESVSATSLPVTWN